MSLVVPPDVVAALLRPLTTFEADYIDQNIAVVEAQLRSALPTVDDRIADYASVPRPVTALDPTLVAGMLAGVLKRYLTNVAGAASSSRTDGPFSTTTTFASYGRAVGEGTPGELQVTAADVASLTPTAARPRLGSIRLHAALAPARNGYCA